MSNIKINDVFQRIQYAATSLQTQFAIPFPFFANAYVYVWQNGVQLDIGGAPGEYAITGAGSPSGGLITLVTPAALDDLITIQGVMPIDRTSIYSATLSNLTGSDLNGDFNREVVMMKQIETTQALLQLQYAPWVEISQDVNNTTDRFLPLLAPQQVWQMNAAGTEIEAVTIDTDNIPAPSDAYYWLSEDNAALPNGVDLGLLTSGILKQTVNAGQATPAIAIPGTDIWVPGDALTRSQAPVTNFDVTNKLYVDTIASGFELINPVRVATTADFSATYDNGASGVGASLTATVNGAASIDGVSLSLNDRVLFKNQASTFQNGIYYVSTLGSGGAPAVYTRTTDFDQPADIEPGDIAPVVAGTVNIGTLWLQTSTVTNIGSDPIVFIQFGASLDNVVTLTGNQTIIGQKTFNALQIFSQDLRLVGALQDSNANTIMTLTPAASAVNRLSLFNAAAGGDPGFMAEGSDTNIGLILLAKGTDPVRLKSASTTTPIAVHSGTGLQHQTNFLFSDTAQTRNATFQDSDGTLAYLADLGFRPIGSPGVASNSASVALTNMTGYTHYLIYYYNVTPATNATSLLVRVSTNNGSSFISTSSYRWQYLTSFNTGVSGAGALPDTSILLASLVNNTAGIALGGRLDIMNPAGTAFTTMVAQSHWLSNASGTQNGFASGQYAATTTVNAIQFFMSSGNISTGTFYLYGIK
jgi:hypothetical protein